MKIKNYSESCYKDLIKCLYHNVEGGNCIYSLIHSLESATEHYPEIKNYFIHDMNAWLTRWFNLCADVDQCSLKLKSKILNVKFATDFSDFNNINIYCNDKATDINPMLGVSYGKDLISFIACTVKAIIQTKRRSLNLDSNSKKYGLKKIAA